MLNEFKKFALRGNVLDLAVGIIIGATFTSVVNSLVNDIIMPPIGQVLGGVDFSSLFIVLGGGSYPSLQAAKDAGAATINYGVFLNQIINFVIVAFAVFLLVRAVNTLMQPAGKKVEETPGEPVNKECPYCLSTIPYKATRCAHCTSELSKG